MAYEIVPYAPEFEPQIIQLQTHLWGAGTVRNAAYLEWKYAANPAARTSARPNAGECGVAARPPRSLAHRRLGSADALLDGRLVGPFHYPGPL